MQKHLIVLTNLPLSTSKALSTSVKIHYQAFQSQDKKTRMAYTVAKKFQKRPREQRSIVVPVFCSAVIAATAILSSSTHPSRHCFKAEAFTPVSHRSLPFSPHSTRTRLFSTENDDSRVVVLAEDTVAADEVPGTTPSAVRTPLKFIGPYPCVALKFPGLATESQRSRNQTGISLDFVLDTAANINTLQGQVAQELNLEKLENSPALPGVSSSGPMGGGETYVLGDSELEDVVILQEESIEKTDSTSEDGNEPFEFMQNLTAAALPVVNPGSAGLLGLAFFYCFEGGVEFRWGASPSTQVAQDSEQRLVDGMMVDPSVSLDEKSSPSITFYGDDNDDDADSELSSELKRSLSELTRVPIDPIPLTQLPSVKIRINGIEMDALLDTGSPVTVLNERAAQAAGIQTTKEAMDKNNEDNNKNGWNPFSGVMDKFKEAQVAAEAAQKGEILMIGGIDGKPTNLYRSIGSSPSISLVDSSGEDVSLGSNNNNSIMVYVGDIPGLAALNGIGVDSPPAVVLGLDVLRQRPRMLFRPRDNELYI